MDRFIVDTVSTWLSNDGCLKSNMDRFIVGIKTDAFDSLDGLKSNMDRFIARHWIFDYICR